MSSRSEPHTRKPRRRLHPTERREEILDAAVDVLGQHGLSARVEDITTAAGTAKGNFYRYFDSVDDLVVAVRDHLLDTYIAALSERRARNPDADWWTVIEDETTRFIDFHLDLGPLHDVLFHSGAAEASPPSAERSAGTLIGALLAEASLSGEVDTTDHEVLGELLFHILHGATDLIRVGAERDRVQSELLRFLHRALRPDHHHPRA
jgi:AcrR family transcriptional regulator